MKSLKNNNSGITLVSLVIMVIIIIILSSIGIYEGSNIINMAKVQTLETNMLTIKAKAKSYAEEVDAMFWSVDDESQTQKDLEKTKREATYKEKYNMTPVTVDAEALNQVDAIVDTENYDAYKVEESALETMGLMELKEDEPYIVIYSSENYNQMDIIYTGGVMYNDISYYTLSALQQVLENE